MSDAEIQNLSSNILTKESGANPILTGLLVVAVGFAIWLWLVSEAWSM